VERGLLFSLWIQSAKDPVATRLALEAIAANQYSTFNNGGRVMVSASVAGKSFSYQIDPKMGSFDIAKAALELWTRVKDFTTTAELENYLTKSNGQMSYPNFGVMSPINT
jgi:hypothetical protein